MKAILFVMLTVLFNTNAYSCTDSITVTNANDSGAGSLRQALLDVCSAGNITFDASYTLYLQSVLTIGESLTIDGVDYDITLSGDSDSDSISDVRILMVEASHNVVIKGVSFIDGGGTQSTGGAISNYANLTIEQSRFERNHASGWGGDNNVYFAGDDGYYFVPKGEGASGNHLFNVSRFGTV